MTKKLKSFYKTEKGNDYIANSKNLNKIRSKNLRNFLMFYWAMKLNIDYAPENKKEALLNNYVGAKTIFNAIKWDELKESNPEMFKQLKEVEKTTGSSISFAQMRTMYDYMNALKYILAVDKAFIETESALRNELIKDLSDENLSFDQKLKIAQTLNKLK